MKELTTTFQPDMLEPNTEADMIFSSLTDLTAECQNYGESVCSRFTRSLKCCATCNGVDIAEVDEKSTAVLQILNFDSQLCEILITSISCELISEIAGNRIMGSVERIGQSQYNISYQPSIKGRHQLHIKVEGQHIRGTFSVTARSPVENLGNSILIITGVNKPDGVAVNQRGEVVVTELNGHCVTVFSPSGERL